MEMIMGWDLSQLYKLMGHKCEKSCCLLSEKSSVAIKAIICVSPKLMLNYAY